MSHTWPVYSSACTNGRRDYDALLAELLLVVSANESRVLGERISSGIEAKKRREGDSFAWGFAVNGVGNKAREVGQKIIKDRALRDATKLVAAVRYLEAQGVVRRDEQLTELHKLGLRTSRGKKLSRVTLHRAFKRLQSPPS